MRTKKDIGFIRKIILKLITKLQAKTIDSGGGLYLLLTKLHFSLYYKKSLVEEAVKNSAEFKKAADRHGNMVMAIMHSKAKKKTVVFNHVKRSFQKDLILKARM